MEKISRHPGPLTPLSPGFLPMATHGVLKSLLENPVKLPLQHEGEVCVCVCVTFKLCVSSKVSTAGEERRVRVCRGHTRTVTNKHLQTHLCLCVGK